MGRACGAGTSCGGCRPEVASILDTEQHAQAANLLDPMRLRMRSAG